VGSFQRQSERTLVAAITGALEYFCLTWFDPITKRFTVKNPFHHQSPDFDPSAIENTPPERGVPKKWFSLK